MDADVRRNMICKTPITGSNPVVASIVQIRNRVNVARFRALFEHSCPWDLTLSR